MASFDPQRPSCNVRALTPRAALREQVQQFLESENERVDAPQAEPAPTESPRL